jgi:transcriptional regulator with GAF, ATPase, and Fis domain
MNAAAGSDTVIASRAMFELVARVDLFAPSELPILVLGETGVGKELITERLHRASNRVGRPLVKVNCASLTESVVESELFGHERGAFTGAHARRVGVFEAADGGTLFLDELGELPLRTQAKLLRVLECGELVPVGGSRPRRVDVRVVAATHRDLEVLVRDGAFREDLYFRLSGVTLRVPPLRERLDEVDPLADHFAAAAAARLGAVPPRLGPDARRCLRAHDWPGNVRELRQVIERAVVMARGGVIGEEHLELSPRRPTSRPPAPPALDDGAAVPGRLPVSPPPLAIRDQLRCFERERIIGALEQTGGNQTQAARLLGISRRTLTNKLNTHGLERPRKRATSS